MTERLSRRPVLYGTAAFLALVYGLVPFRFGVVVGESMSPSYLPGTPFVLDARSGQPRVGDIVVFHHEGEDHVKRVVGVPGQVLYVSAGSDGVQDVLVREWQLAAYRRLDESAIRHTIRLVPRLVPEDCLYVVGDNLAQSYDSRDFGFVPLHEVRGRIVNAPLQPHDLGELAQRPRILARWH